MTKHGNNRQRLPAISRVTFIWSFLLVGIVLLAFLFYIFAAHDPLAWLKAHLTAGTDPLLFAVLMAVLPLVGAPLSIFLLLVGMIFGLAGGIGVTGLLMLFHMAATWYLVHSLFKPLVLKLINRSHVGVPRLPSRGRKRLALVFMLVPGLPYAVKNYLLALSGLPFRQYLAISWLAQFTLSIPFIMLGKAVIKMDPVIFTAALVILVVGFAGQHYLRRQYRNLREKTPDFE